MTDLKKYYLEQSNRSKISKKFADEFPDTPNEIMKKVRKLIFHPVECIDNFDDENWPRYFIIKELEEKLKKQTLVAGKCREYTLLSVAVMRAKGIPARSRCGFATYFDAGIYEDHWVVEYWDNGWKMADAQKKRYNLTIGEFINGAIAWQLVRKYNFNPSLFGFTGSDCSLGFHYVVGQLIRDVSGLLKDELEYSELSKIMFDDYKLNDKELALFDSVSELVLAEDIEKLKSIFAKLRKDIKWME
ncbi:MAG: transglutaminase-like domain-containing protein [Alphaproteobacteria bacterium]